jgi:toxin FitB
LSGYLLDTNVVSEIRKGERANPGVRAWFDASEPDELFLSVLVVGELRRGVELIRRRDASTARALERWLRTLERSYAERILPVTVSICDRWGRMGLERPVPPIDGLLAATALDRRLTLVTRNEIDVAGCGADVLNPFSR